MDGASVIGQFVAAGYVDDLTLSTVRILLGDGIPLLGWLDREARLELKEGRPFASGLVQAYRGGVGPSQGAP